MKSIFILISIFLAILLSCKKKETFKYYSFDFYPVIEIRNSGTWIETDFLSDEKLSFQINSLRILEEYHDFEALNMNDCRFYSDKDFIINSDTIKAGENLLKRIDSEMISFKQHIGEYGKEYSWYYLIIKSTEYNKLNISSDYYQFNLEGTTEHGYIFKDSLMIKYNNR
jgi:hypothetical protein